MNDLFNWLQSNVHKAVGVPALISTVQFLAMLMQYASDGVIDETELHQLLTTGSAINLAILIVVYAFLKARKS